MSRSLVNAAPSVEVQTLDRVRFKQAHAVLPSRSGSTVQPESRSASTPVHNGLLDRLAGIVESALVTVHGSQKSAAIEIQCDQSQMKRQLRLGTFDLRQQAAAGETFLATLGELLVEAFGTARKSKKKVAIERLPELLGLMLAALEEDK